MSNYNWGYKNAASLSKELAGGGKVTVTPHTRAPRSPSPQGYAKGGAVKHSDAKQDKAMIARHNRLMHPGQKSKLAKGGPINIKPENKGKLRASLGAAPGKPIPKAKIAKAVKSSNPVLKKRAVFAQNAAKWKKG
jgi:hypothetical protein